ncbi:T9SS type B sorting domain-containing protein [Capnocytophaga granulosa]|uniref:T9SS type B sorting domain-containing protein n=1 Tax=Capnocytophaga granulosa TaxID=45242 RepID=UPI0038571B5D
MKEMRKRTTSFIRLLIFTLLTLSMGAVWGQVTINSVIAQSPVHFAGNSDFSVGELTVSFNMPTGKTSGELQVNLAAGIEYMPGTVTATGATVSLKTGSTDANKPVFTLTGASGSVTVKFKRKATKAVLTNPALAGGLQDEAVLTVQGLAPSPAVKNVVPYQLPRPTLAVQLPTTQTDVLGARTETFDIRNTGNGIVKDVYFSIAYDHRDVVGLSVSHNGTPLTQVGTVPIGLPNAGKPIYKIANANLANNGVVTITEKYTVNKCTTGRQNTYYAYWGSGIANSNDIFETNSNTRNISVSTGIPIIRHSDNSAFNYFKWQDGFCGNILGTYYVRFNNETADPKGTAYNVEVKLFDGDPTIGFSVFEPINIRLVATDGTEIPISATGTGDTRIINFTDLAAVSNASLGSRDVGFTDEDGDGFKDDLKKDAYFQIAFDLKRKQSFQCLQPGKGPKNYFSLQPRAYVLYDNVCKGKRDSSDLRLIDYGTMRIYFNGVNDASKLPAQLVENVPSAGYIAPGMNWPSLGIHQRTKNTTLADNERQFKYVITTPAGIKLQNVKLYRKTNIFGASPTTPVNQPDIEAGTTVTITTSNTPADRDNTSGYLSFDALLQSCNGATAPITYSVYLMVKNGDGTYCDIPLVCNQVTNIPTICSTSCTIQGPRMLSTKVERADNSYGWKDYTMAVRQTRANVSSIERMRALYLDDIEFISEGQQHTGKTATNLFYYAKVENTAKLEPKKITLKVNGGAEQTFTATPNNPMRGTDAAGKNYFRWNLTSLLPTGTLPAGATFTAVATYQVINNNPTNSNDRTMDIQSGIESFFYTLDNPATDVAISTEGYHTAEKHCGANLTPIFYIAETQSMLATNEYKEFSGCNIVELGGNLIYAARRFKSGGTYFSQEFRPARLTKKITIKMPSAYRINNIKYTYTYKIAEAAKEATVDMSRLTVIDDGTWKTYTYINPPKGTTGHLPPGMITVVNDYNEYLKVFIQPSCKAKTVDGNKTYWDQGLDAKAMNEIISSNIEYEDYYYHYAETGNSAIAIDKLNDRPILFAESKKPEITIEAISQLTVKANKRVMEATFKLKNIKEYDAPFGWISVPDVTGIEVLSLEEGGHTYTAQNSISGEKMFFLSDKGDNGKILKNSERQFKLKYKITNCAAALELKVYAGWNCNENPTSGYRNTCSDKFITYNIAIALSKKEIAADPGNPGENDPNKKGSIPMCTATPYTYVINSAEEGDIYNAKLVVTQGNGITISNVKVEYPLGGTVYTVGTGAGKILHTQSGNRHTYDISNILPEGSLPGSLNEPNNANKRKFKLTFDVTPDCDFSAGSSFDIDVEGTNLCDSPAAGDKTRAIIAGINGVNINDYSITLDPLTYVSGNGTLCGGGVVYKTRVTVNSSTPTFQMGPNARLRFTIPEGYELAPSYAHYYGRTPYGPGALWSTPVRKQAEEKTLASGSELVMEIPAGMKNGQFFEFGIHIIQKADALIDCDLTNPKKLKVIATDTKTGVMCNGTACPPMTVSTSKEEKVAIKNERPKLSLKDVSATSSAQAGKENLTIKYKIENGTGTDVATLANGTVKAALYYDANHNNIVDTGDIKLSTHTTTALTLAQGATSAEQIFTFAVDQDKVCRLLLVLKNEDNVCLCGDVVAPLTAPEKITGLVDNLTVCESETKKVAYSAAGASYDQYTWTGKTANDKLDYLSAVNVKEPNFHYNGTKLTATQTFTYVLTVKRTNGCEATQEVKVTVQPAPSISTQPVEPAAYCQGVTATALTVTANTHGVTGTLSYQWYSNTSNSTTGGTPVGTNANSYVPLTTTAVTLYYYVKITNSTCGEVLSDVVKVEVKPTPDKPTIDLTAESCTAATVAKISNYVSSGVTYTFTKADGTPVTGVTIATDGVLSGLAAGTYKVKAEKDGCTSDISDSFEIKAQKAAPAQPTVTLTAESCAAPTKAVISNYVSGQTYWNGATQLTVDNNSHEITGLAAGTYTITAKNNDNCESVASDSFEIKAQKAVPAKPTIDLTAESCVAPTKAVISNYVSGQTYWNGATQLTVDNTSHQITGLAVGTYTITAKNNDNCESIASDSFEIKAQKAVPVQPTVTLIAESCTAPTKAVISNYVSGQTYWNGATQLTVDNTSHEITGLAAGTYTITAKNNDNCESVASDSFEIKAQKAVPVQPTVTLTAESCVAPTKAVISNYVPGQTYWNGATQLTVDNTSHEITGLAVGTYTITAKNNDNCESVASDSFEIKAQKAAPAQPTVTLTAESCTAPTKAVISNYVSGQTYWNGATQLTVNGTSHEITGLAAGTYTITTKIGNCESVASDSFVIKAQKAATIIGANPQSAVYVKDTSATPLTAAATGEGTLTYKWYENTTNSYTGGTEVGRNNTYTPATDTVGSLFYWAEITGECGTEKTSIAEIKVVEGAPTIEANDDPDTTVRRGQEVAVLGNDKVNGNPATPADVDITISKDGGLTRVGVNPATGKIMIPNDAAPATYEITYKICVKNQPTICDEAKVKITVEEPVRTLKAVDDDFGKVPNTVDYTTTNTVFSTGVDTLEGVPSTLSPERDVVLTPGAQPHENIIMNPNGSITVKRGTPKGTYTYEYTICQKDVPTNCDTAKVSFEVIEAHIFAKDDGVWEVGTEGALTPSILNNDILGERVGIAPSEVDIQQTPGEVVVDKTLMMMNEDGRISVKKSIAEGSYTYYYTIIEKANTANFSKAKVIIRVVNFSAQDDEFNITNDKTKEFKTESVLANDELNKKKNPSPVDDVILTKGEAKDSERNPTTALTMNDDGTITIAPNTPDGVYTYTYTICKKSAPTECKSAEAVIKLLPALIANDDDFTANPINPLVKEGIAGNVLDNDRYSDGKASEHFDKVQITMLDNDKSGARIKQNGDVVIPQGAPAGDYTLAYSLCMKDHSTICDEAKVKITVGVPVRALKAVDDDFGKIPNTLDYTTTNTVFSTGVDTMDGVVGNLSPERDVVLTPGAQPHENITMNPNGSITVKRGTPKGTYTYEYTICQKDVPTNCDTAKATFEVVDNTILAKDDVFEMGTSGGLTPSVLNNDIFAGKVGPTTSEVIIEPTLNERNDDTKLKMRFIDGRIDVEKGIAPGPHKYYYTISDKKDKTKSSSAVVTIRVVSFAAGDDEHEVFNNNGTEQHIDKPSIFDNDEVDGKTPKPGDNVTFKSPPVKDKDGNEVPGIVINPQDGTITVASGTPDGVYTYSYTICKTVAPNECKTAKGVLKLLPALKAVDDDFTATPVNTTKGAVNVGNVLENDLYAGKNALDHLDKVTAKIEDNNGGISGAYIDEQGNLIIPQGTPVGVYDLEYNLCMKEHPGVCKTAKVRVEVIKDKPLTIYNGVSADGDGHNDYFKIDGIEYYPKNNLKIFNRWGVLVYEKDGYSNEAPFDGHSNGRATISADSKLPQGTYYYILEYEDSDDQSHTEKGWLYLKY